MNKFQYVITLHRYYRITLFYKFLKDLAIKGGILIILFVGILLALEYFFLDFNSLLNSLFVAFSPKIVFLSFLVSETIFGLLPPEIFIAWSAKSATPWLFLFILASMSYLGGTFAFLIGRQLAKLNSVKRFIEKRISKHIVSLRKWGGFFVFLGAMLPLPHSIISLASGLINYSFKHYLFWALFRYLRFFLYALVIFRIW
jgi:membrane protein YqaA with SNARE-associated domain